MEQMPRFLREGEAAALLGLSPKTLSRWRWAGRGPAYRKFGSSVRYAVVDLERYTSEA
jgi:predicted DNA-binding transcriptional regulator AlpA